LEHLEAEFVARRGTAAGLDLKTIFEDAWLEDLEASFLEMIPLVMENAPSTAAKFTAGYGGTNCEQTNQKIVNMANAILSRTADQAALTEIDKDRPD